MANRSIFDDILSARPCAEQPAILGQGAAVHRQLLERVGYAARLFERYSAAKAVAIALPHGAANIVALLAARASGLVAIPVNPRAPKSEKLHVLENSGAELLVVEASDPFGRGLADCRPAGTFEGADLIQLPNATGYSQEEGDCVVIYTSGSTGRPKGVVLSEGALSANVRAVADDLSLSPRDRLVAFTPPSFAYAQNQILTHLWIGGAILPWPSGLLEPLKMLQAANANGVTGIQANPTLFRLMFRIPEDEWPDMSGVRYVMCGGQPLDTPLACEIRERFSEARIVNMYGCTENAPRISSFWLPKRLPDEDKSFPVGKPIAGTRIRIVDQNRAVLQSGELGEIEVSGTSIMSRYLGEPGLTAERLRDGWFSTRDFGSIDEQGDLHVGGRLDNIFSVGHEKVAPEEVEDLLSRVPGVREVAVGALSDPVLGAIPGALVVTDGDFADVLVRIHDAGTELSRAKRPRHYFQVEELPRTLYGKIDRRGLRSMLSAFAGARGAAPKPPSDA